MCAKRAGAAAAQEPCKFGVWRHRGSILQATKAYIALKDSRQQLARVRVSPDMRSDTHALSARQTRGGDLLAPYEFAKDLGNQDTHHVANASPQPLDPSALALLLLRHAPKRSSVRG